MSFWGCDSCHLLPLFSDSPGQATWAARSILNTLILSTLSDLTLQKGYNLNSLLWNPWGPGLPLILLTKSSEQWRWTVIKCWVLVWFYLWLLLENGRALEGSVCPLTLHPKVFRESTVQHRQSLTVGCYVASSQGPSGRIWGALGTEQSVRSGQRVGNTSFVGGWSSGLCFFGSLPLPHFHISQVPRFFPFQAGLMKPGPSLPISPKQRWVGRFWVVLGTAPGGGRMRALGSAGDVGFAWHVLLLFRLAARCFFFQGKLRNVCFESEFKGKVSSIPGVRKLRGPL